MAKKDLSLASRGKHYIEVEYDFAKDGGAVGAIDALLMQEKVLIHSAVLKVHTLFASGGAATLSVGQSGSPADIISAQALAALVADAAIDEVATPLNLVVPKGGVVVFDIAVAAMTAGKATLVLECSQMDEA